MNSMPTPGVTTNYRAAYAKLDKDSATIDVATDSMAMGTDSTLLTVRYNSAVMPDPTINDNGTVDYIFGADTFAYGPANTTLGYSKEANSEVEPFTADIEPLLINIDDGEVSTVLTQAFDLTGNDLRFGRINMSNTHDSELVDLTMPMFTEYLQIGGFYAKNDDDNCTTLVTADLAMGIVGNLSTPGSSTVEVDNTPIPILGDIDVFLSAPGSGVTGSIQVTPDLNRAQNNRWLRYDWQATGEFDNDPSAIATFGIFRGNPVQIFIEQSFQ
ncbi:MAG: MSHA biogenesis protein MshQ [Planctomycetota bacterium]|jgi:MSHA biogenesis protein MshQ